jgi:hypothetical protein
MNDREPPGYDDWFDEPEPPTLEQGRGGRQPYDSPSVTEEDVWTLPEDESRPRRGQRHGDTGIGGLTTTQIAIIAIAGLVILVAILAAFGVFDSGTPATSPTVNTHTTTLPTTAITTTITVKAPTQPLREGDTGPQVKLLQHALISLGYLSPPADGDFGPATTSAVQHFQTNSGLPADGIVGQQTLAALKQALGG